MRVRLKKLMGLENDQALRACTSQPLGTSELRNSGTTPRTSLCEKQGFCVHQPDRCLYMSYRVTKHEGECDNHLGHEAGGEYFALDGPDGIMGLHMDFINGSEGENQQTSILTTSLDTDKYFGC